jgi:hypothetical protein
MRFRFSLASQTTTEVQEAVAIRDVIEKIAPKAIQLPENGLTTYSLLFDQRDSFREELMKKTDGLHTSEAMVELTHRLADASWIFVVRSTYGLYYEVVLPETLGRRRTTSPAHCRVSLISVRGSKRRRGSSRPPWTRSRFTTARWPRPGRRALARIHPIRQRSRRQMDALDPRRHGSDHRHPHTPLARVGRSSI